MKRIRVTYSDKGATLDGPYRYNLWRVWNSTAKRIIYVMLNPSTADAFEDDPTIEQCVHFAARDGFGSISVVNLFAYKATNPKHLKSLGDKTLAIGPRNSDVLMREVNAADRLVLAWGEHGSLYNRHLDPQIQGLCMSDSVYCLGTTRDGHPRHPGRVALDTAFEPYVYPFGSRGGGHVEFRL